MKRLILTIILVLIAFTCFAQYNDNYKTIANEPTSKEQLVAMSTNAADYTSADLTAISEAQRNIRVGKTLTYIGVGVAAADVVATIIAATTPSKNNRDSNNDMMIDDMGVRPAIYTIGAASVTTFIIGITKWNKGNKVLQRLSATPSGGLAFNF